MLSCVIFPGRNLNKHKNQLREHDTKKLTPKPPPQKPVEGTRHRKFTPKPPKKTVEGTSHRKVIPKPPQIPVEGTIGRKLIPKPPQQNS